jgi:tetratricopeptide (TPR) repeat protein
MRGRHAAAVAMIPNIDMAEQLFRKSVAVDPNYPLPYVALAELYLHADILELRPSPELVGKAKEALAKALALDGRIVAAHALLGSLMARHEYDWPNAEKQLHDAIQLDSNSAPAHNILAQDILAPQGRWPEAVAEQRRAMELDPGSPLIAAGQPFLKYLQREFDLALTGFRELAAGNALDITPLWGAGVSLVGKGDYPGALAIFNPLYDRGSAPFILASIGYIHGRTGNVPAARKTIDQLNSQSKSGYVSSSCFALVHIGLNDRDKAFEYMEHGRANQESYLIFTRVDSLFDPIRSDPRFNQLLVEIGLDDASVYKNQSLRDSVHR